MSVELRELDPIDRGDLGVLHIVQASAHLEGGGTRVIMESGYDIEEVRAKAQLRGEKAERQLAALEVHDEDALEHLRRADLRLLKSPGGAIVEATAETVEALIAAGYEPIDVAETEEVPVEVGANPRKRRQAKKVPVDEM